MMQDSSIEACGWVSESSFRARGLQDDGAAARSPFRALPLFGLTLARDLQRLVRWLVTHEETAGHLTYC